MCMVISLICNAFDVTNHIIFDVTCILKCAWKQSHNAFIKTFYKMCS